MSDVLIDNDGFLITVVDKTVPRSEQETIINYDRETDQWHVYTTVPKHARKYEDKTIAEGNIPEKIYNAGSDQLIGLNGVIDGTVSVQKKREMSEEQKEAARKRLQEYHKNKGEE